MLQLYFANSVSMIFAQLLAFAILAFAVSDGLKLKNCDSRMPVQVKEIKVYPDPVILKKGEKITISGKFTHSIFSFAPSMD
ncbi:hypothetical protein P5673_018440, partial [Acropora cervicornis]